MTAADGPGTPITQAYARVEPARADFEALPGSTLLEFGAPWCGICRAAQPAIAAALANHAGVRHLKIADASGQPLGRSFGVKLWPTLVFLRDGTEVARLVWPRDVQAIDAALSRLHAA